MEDLGLKIEVEGLRIEDRQSRFHHATPTFNTHLIPHAILINTERMRSPRVQTFW